MLEVEKVDDCVRTHASVLKQILEFLVPLRGLEAPAEARVERLQAWGYGWQWSVDR